MPNDINIQLANQTYMEELVPIMKKEENKWMYETLKKMGLATGNIKITTDQRHLEAIYS